MFEDLKKAQRKRKKKKMVAQRAKAEQAHAAQKKQGKASARPNIPSSSVRESLNSVSESSAEARANKQGSQVGKSVEARVSQQSNQAGKGAEVRVNQQGVQAGKTTETRANQQGAQAGKATETKAGQHSGQSGKNTEVKANKQSGQRGKTAGAKANQQGGKSSAPKSRNSKATHGKRSKAVKPNAARGYQEKLLQHKKDVIKKALIIAGIAVGVLVLMCFFMEKGSYHNYRILQTSEQEDVISTNYVELDGKILRYSPDGAALVDSKLQTHWSELYNMENPIADVCGDSAVIADQDGTTIKIFNKNGLTGSVTTSHNIVKVHVSESGLVAAILDGGDETWINYYSTDGSLIAENQTKIEDPGYPMDVAISKDGTVMMVAYQFVDGGDTTSYVAFYNFGDVGQNEDDRIVSGYTYDGIVVPQVEYLGDDRSVALRDDGFTIYKGKQIPKESETIEVEDEIISTFYNDDLIGLVFKSGDKDKPYTMQVYSSSGNLKFEKNFNIPYTTIKMSGDHIIMYNSSQMCVLNSRGVEKYSGTIDGTIKNLFKIGWNRYLLVLDTGVKVIKFS